MENVPTTAREKIVYSTIDCIERYGINNLTVRNIAAAAGVNSAAINYYFRSKDQLIAEAVRCSLQHAFSDWERFLGDPGLSPAERFRGFLTDFFEGGMRFPGMTRAYLFDSAMQEKYEDLFVPRFNALLDRFAKGLQASSPGVPEGRIRFSVVQIISAIMFAVLSPKFFDDFLGRGFTEEGVRKAFIDHLLVTYMPGT
jgi:AcrR family transcriptional regulator